MIISQRLASTIEIIGNYYY